MKTITALKKFKALLCYGNYCYIHNIAILCQYYIMRRYTKYNVKALLCYGNYCYIHNVAIFCQYYIMRRYTKYNVMQRYTKHNVIQSITSLKQQFCKHSDVMESIDISLTSPFSANIILCDVILSITRQKNHVLQQSDIIKIFNSCCLFSSLTVCFLSILIRVVVQLWSGLLVWLRVVGQFQNGRVIFHCPCVFLGRLWPFSAIL